MGVLEQVTQLKGQGMQDPQIINSLQQQGVPPKQITDALAQSQVKTAVAGAPAPATTGQAGMQPSIMTPNPESAAPAPAPIAPNPKQPEPAYPEQQVPMPPQPVGGKMYAPEQGYADQGYSGEYYAPEQQNYAPEAGYEGYGTPSSDTTVEIAEQVFDEKIKEVEKKVKENTDFKILSEVKIENLSERLKKIESTIDKLQVAILEKIGSYGTNLETIKKEMYMIENSFRKVAGKKPRSGKK